MSISVEQLAAALEIAWSAEDAKVSNLKKRELFAALAMSKLAGLAQVVAVNNASEWAWECFTEQAQVDAKASVIYADALLAALNKSPSAPKKQEGER